MEKAEWCSRSAMPLRLEANGRNANCGFLPNGWQIVNSDYGALKAFLKESARLCVPLAANGH